MPKTGEVSDLLTGSTKSCIRYTIGLREQLLSELETTYSLDLKNFSVRFKNNASHLFSTLTSESLKSQLIDSELKYRSAISSKEISVEISFESHLLDSWVNNQKSKH